ncbi:MAG: carbonic anhydrase family protein [Deltaproteobacteria bacterium]|nr:carbonic anhydrase family protein [Deltaproteobacteria bacterium]
MSAPALAGEKGNAHWSYEGEHGPEHWGGMSKEFEKCSKGARQSPIDITGAAVEKSPAIDFAYKPTKLKLWNNGHTVQVNYETGSFITVGKEKYQLAQFHFHNPSEHTLGNKPFAIELHLVHKNAKGALAVVGILLEEGAENLAYKAVFANLPKNADTKIDADLSINAETLLPSDRTYYRYDGSLTTPPCSEGVNWFVLKTPIQLSKEQLASYNGIFKKTNRPVQPLHDRKIQEAAAK